jgi:membrane associated rhomboid family serine protease
MTAAPVGYQCPDCVREARQSAPRRRVRVRFLLGRPGSMTTLFLVLNIAMFVVEVATGASRSVWGGNENQLIRLGAMFPPAIAVGHQYWRLVTVMFLHAGLIHLALNMYALYLFGYLIENAFGKLRFVAIYLVAGFLASVLSFAFGPVFEVGVGASGAIFGLLGAWVAYNYRRRGSPDAESNLQGALLLIVVNLILSFSIPGIDWRAHVGGLASGLIAGGLAEGVGPWQIRRYVQVGGLGALILIGIGLTAWRVVTFPLS